MNKLLLIALLTTLPLLAAPAFEHVRTFTQPDGTAFEGIVRGDEHLHWVEASNGAVLVFNKQTKRYEYAKIAVDALLPDGREFHPGQQQMSSERNTEAVSSEALRLLWLKRYEERTKFRTLRK